MQSYTVCVKGTICQKKVYGGGLFPEKWYIKGRYSHGNYILYECYSEKKFGSL